MIILGMVTDGEYNNLQVRGSTRPLHLWEVIHKAKESVQRLKKKDLENCMFSRDRGKYIYLPLLKLLTSTVSVLILLFIGYNSNFFVQCAQVKVSE